jgi:hypothetical protein
LLTLAPIDRKSRALNHSRLSDGVRPILSVIVAPELPRKFDHGAGRLARLVGHAAVVVGRLVDANVGIWMRRSRFSRRKRQEAGRRTHRAVLDARRQPQRERVPRVRFKRL